MQHGMEGQWCEWLPRAMYEVGMHRAVRMGPGRGPLPSSSGGVRFCQADRQERLPSELSPIPKSIQSTSVFDSSGVCGADGLSRPGADPGAPNKPRAGGKIGPPRMRLMVYPHIASTTRCPEAGAPGSCAASDPPAASALRRRALPVVCARSRSRKCVLGPGPVSHHSTPRTSSHVAPSSIASISHQQSVRPPLRTKSRPSICRTDTEGWPLRLTAEGSAAQGDSCQPPIEQKTCTVHTHKPLRLAQHFLMSGGPGESALNGQALDSAIRMIHLLRLAGSWLAAYCIPQLDLANNVGRFGLSVALSCESLLLLMEASKIGGGNKNLCNSSDSTYNHNLGASHWRDT